MQYKLGFIGAGNMAEAIATAAIEAKVLTPQSIIAADPSPQRLEIFRQKGIAIAQSNAQLIENSQQIMIAVKPQSLHDIALELGSINIDKQIILSIMAGISSQKIAEAAGGKALRIVRIMPNTPVMVGLGMTGIALGAHAQEGDDQLAMSVFGAAGEAIAVQESQIDAITAISGSGPAYLFLLAEAMHEAACQLGLDANARTLVQQTLLGAATLLVQSPDTPAELRRKVSSPGGTTEAAINTMMQHQVPAGIIEGIKKAQIRSLELGQ